MNESPTPDSLSWVKPYYTRAGDYWGPPGINEGFEERLAILTRLCGSRPLRILELGAGTGEAAQVMADAGHAVVAIEFSPTRAGHLKSLAGLARKGSLTAIEADFYEVSLEREFDVICYWDGFGVGSDQDQRTLLCRIASEWLKPQGCALIDVFNPYRWALESGREWVLERNHPSHRFRQRRRFNFDPVQGCFLDQWRPIDDETNTCDESRAITQKIRCYNPADFMLLLEGTGLSLDHFEVSGTPIELGSGTTTESPIWNAWSYLAKLVTS